MKLLAVDLFCGLGGWADGFLAEGYSVVGFDIECHDYGMGGYLGQLVLQDVLTLDGSQFKDATVIVASPPCQKYSYMAMPWKRAKALAAWYRESLERIAELNALFNACFRIQREASEAVGRHIPLIVENVKGAQPWVGPAAWHFGSFYLWGDIPALMPIPRVRAKINGQDWTRFAKTGEVSPHWRMQGLKGPETEWLPNGTRANSNRMVATDEFKNNGGSWFAVAHNTTSGHSQNPVRGEKGNSLKRKQASAMIAKIPLPLAQHIARSFKP